MGMAVDSRRFQISWSRHNVRGMKWFSKCDQIVTEKNYRGLVSRLQADLASFAVEHGVMERAEKVPSEQ